MTLHAIPFALIMFVLALVDYDIAARHPTGALHYAAGITAIVFAAVGIGMIVVGVRDDLRHGR